MLVRASDCKGSRKRVLAMPKGPRDEQRWADAIAAAVIAGRIAIAALWTTAVIPGPAIGEESVSKTLKCDIGPIIKSYGMTQWLVYSCDDHRTVVIVSAPGNPATPFVFTFFARENGYQLHGEGTGRKDATAAAFEELKVLSERDIAALIEQTEQR